MKKSLLTPLFLLFCAPLFANNVNSKNNALQCTASKEDHIFDAPLNKNLFEKFLETIPKQTRKNHLNKIKHLYDIQDKICSNCFEKEIEKIKRTI